MKTVISALIAITLLGSASAAAAQTAPNPTQFLDVAMQLARAVDANQALQIWESASPVMKRATPRDRFVATVNQRLSLNGRIQGRDWSSISRVKIPAGASGLPAGEYLTVALAGVNKNGVAIRESISFVLDGDKMWRLAGYAVQ